MRKALVGFLGSFVVPALMVAAFSCGSTDETHPPAETADEFVSETCQDAAGACLSLNSQHRVLVGDQSSFNARLVNIQGKPKSGVQLCFRLGSSAGRILDPPSFCNLTDANGFVPGTLIADRRDDTFLSVDAPKAFNLHVERSISFVTP